MKILVLGAGAVGLAVAARLSLVCDVTAISRKRTVDAITDQGLILTGIWGEKTYSLNVSEQVPKGDRFDYVIISAKSRDTEPICQTYADIIKNTETVSLQNGIGNEEIISRYTSKVIGGMIITGFEWRGDNKVHVSVEAGPAQIGRFPTGLDEPVQTLEKVMKDAGIPVQSTKDIRAGLWGKTLYNSALNPLGALMGVPYGELTAPAAQQIITQIINEAFLIIHAEKIQLTWKSADDYLAFLNTVQLPATALHHSSMLQDLSRGRLTEIDFINGAIVRKGVEHGIPTPVNACITNLIKLRESLIIKGKK